MSHPEDQIIKDKEPAPGQEPGGWNPFPRWPKQPGPGAIVGVRAASDWPTDRAFAVLHPEYFPASNCPRRHLMPLGVHVARFVGIAAPTVQSASKVLDTADVPVGAEKGID